MMAAIGSVLAMPVRWMAHLTRSALSGYRRSSMALMRMSRNSDPAEFFQDWGPIGDLARKYVFILLKGFIERRFFGCAPLAQLRQSLVDCDAKQPGR
jgi:hypothetical protein